MMSSMSRRLCCSQDSSGIFLALLLSPNVDGYYVEYVDGHYVEHVDGYYVEHADASLLNSELRLSFLSISSGIISLQMYMRFWAGGRLPWPDPLSKTCFND